jgi:uncharacterized protein YyaL (SSP411 family)
VLAGDPSLPAFRRLHAAALASPTPPVILSLAALSDDEHGWLAKQASWLAATPLRPADAAPAAYVCRNGVCFAPVEQAAELRRLLETPVLVK